MFRKEKHQGPEEPQQTMVETEEPQQTPSEWPQEEQPEEPQQTPAETEES